MRYERGRLAAGTPSLTQHLHALARQGASARSGGDLGGTLELSRDEGRPPLLAHIFPLAANRMVAVLDINQPAAAVFVVSLGRSWRPNPPPCKKFWANPRRDPRPYGNYWRKRASCCGRAVEN